MTQFALASLYKMSATSQLLIPTFRQLDGSSNFQFVGVQSKAGKFVDFKLGNLDAFVAVYPHTLRGDRGYHSLIEIGDFGFLCLETSPDNVQTILWPNLEERWNTSLRQELNDFSSYLVRKLFDSNALAKTPKLGEEIRGWRSAEYIGQRTLDRTWKKVELPDTPPPKPVSEATILAAYESKYHMLRQLDSLNNHFSLNDAEMREWRILFSKLWTTRYDVDTVLSLAASQITKCEIGSSQFQYIFDAVSGFLDHPNLKDAVTYILDELVDTDSSFRDLHHPEQRTATIQETQTRLNELSNFAHVLLKILNTQLPKKGTIDGLEIEDLIHDLFCIGLGEVENDSNIDAFSADHTILKIIEIIPLLERDIGFWAHLIEQTAGAIEAADLRKERRAYLMRRLRSNITVSGVETLKFSTASTAGRQKLEALIESMVNSVD